MEEFYSINKKSSDNYSVEFSPGKELRSIDSIIEEYIDSDFLIRMFLFLSYRELRPIFEKIDQHDF